jgi:hypothetical protein
MKDYSQTRRMQKYDGEYKRNPQHSLIGTYTNRFLTRYPIYGEVTYNSHDTDEEDYHVINDSTTIVDKHTKTIHHLTAEEIAESIIEAHRTNTKANYELRHPLHAVQYAKENDNDIKYGIVGTQQHHYYLPRPPIRKRNTSNYPQTGRQHH